MVICFDRVKDLEQVFIGIPERFHNDSCRKLSAPVYPYIENIFCSRIQNPAMSLLKVSPLPNKEAFRSTWVFPLSWLKNTPGDRCELADHDTFRAVYNKGTRIGHQRHLADINVFFP